MPRHWSGFRQPWSTPASNSSIMMTLGDTGLGFQKRRSASRRRRLYPCLESASSPAAADDPTCQPVQCNAQRYERTEARRETRASHFERKLQTKAGSEAERPEASGTNFRDRDHRALPAARELDRGGADRDVGVSVRRVGDITDALWGTGRRPRLYRRSTRRSYGATARPTPSRGTIRGILLASGGGPPHGAGAGRIDVERAFRFGAMDAARLIEHRDAEIAPLLEDRVVLGDEVLRPFERLDRRPLRHRGSRSTATGSSPSP
jgi:hypothetical protein